MPIRPVKPKITSNVLTPMPPVRVRSRTASQSQTNATAPDINEAQQLQTKPDYAVGYGKPPVSSRFKPGQSGNPKGRPKASKGLNTIVRDIITQIVAVRTAHGEKRISRIEAALHKTVELAMKGNPRALAQLLKLYADAVPDGKSKAVEQETTEDLTATDFAMLEELRFMLLAGEGSAR